MLTNVPDHMQILAEPGRAISAPSMALVCKVIGRAKRRDAWWFYLDDGVYGHNRAEYSMECITGCRYSRRVTSNQRACLLDQLVIRLMNLEGIQTFQFST